ncbi:hypothetical protein [Mesorhizobium sp. J8]|uniref:hypothetical protein n=1 Tax=Mesorhizobium sp. J8 TaxID=2777475 RepID=UPI001915ECBA|nr:hypothetical protein [Mesorhizobium sp. J8]
MSVAKALWEQILTVFLSRGADDLDDNRIAAGRLGVRRTSGRAGRSRRLARQLMRLREQEAGERYEAFVTARRPGERREAAAGDFGRYDPVYREPAVVAAPQGMSILNVWFGGPCRAAL